MNINFLWDILVPESIAQHFFRFLRQGVATAGVDGVDGDGAVEGDEENPPNDEAEETFPVEENSWDRWDRWVLNQK